MKTIFFFLLIFVLQALPGLAASDGPESPGGLAEDADPAFATGYETRRLTFENGKVPQAGSLVLPPGEGPFPAVVILHGSAPATRALFWETGDAQAFLQGGIAVFIYDKRGMGESGGDWRSASLEDLARDAAAAVALVRKQPGIQADQVGLFGVSQGGWLEPLVAANNPQVSFVVDVTGAALPLANQEMWSASNELRRRGFSEPALDTNLKLMHLLFSARPVFNSGLVPQDFYVWFKALDPYLDPASYWAEVKQPVFVAYGAEDPTVPTRASVAVLSELLAEGGHPASRVVVYPQAGHGVRLEDGSWAPGHINTMLAWVQAVTRGEQPAPAAQPPDFNQVEIEASSQPWYGLGSVRTPWYAGAAFQFGLVGLFLVVFGVGLVIGLSGRLDLSLPAFGRLPRLAFILACLLNLLLLAGWVSTAAYLAFADPNGSGPAVPFASLLAALAAASALLAVCLVFFAFFGGRSGEWSHAVVVLYGLVALAAAGYTAFLGYWNLLGPLL